MTETASTEQTASAEFAYDPFAPGYAENPYPTYAHMRAAGRVNQHPLGFYTLSHYADVTELLFSKNSVEDRNMGPGVFRDLIEATSGGRPTGALGLSMLDRDAPDHTYLMRERTDLDLNAVDELLRYDSPVQMSRRITLAPYEVDGQTIPTGSFVQAGLASANRDEDFWGTDAGELRLDRTNAKAHLSFGGGPHHCLGAALARMEGRVAITGLIRRFPTLELDGEVAWNGRLNLRGPSALNVRVG